MQLDEFAKSYDPYGTKTQWCETLPEDIQAQILASDAGHTTVVEWLIQSGYVDATRSKVAYFRKTSK